jgi:DNA-binding response OmpR family regulator
VERSPDGTRPREGATLPPVSDLLIASDASWIVDEVRAGVEDGDTTLRSVSAGLDVLPAVREQPPDLVVLDLNIGNMGGMATCLNLRLEESAGRLPHLPVLMLLDREADVFLARRSDAEGWLIKPLDAMRIRKAVRAILAGGEHHEGTGWGAPQPAPA